MAKIYILILTHYDDLTVEYVIDWLLHYNVYKVIRINTEDNLEILKINTVSEKASEFTLAINSNLIIKSEEIYSYWYRRGQLFLNNITSKVYINTNPPLLKSLQKYYLKEHEHVLDYLHYLLKNKGLISINAFTDIFTNKLVNLDVAKGVGLKIPASIISENPKNLREFILHYGKCITKPIRYPGSGFETNDGKSIGFAQFTSVINIESFDALIANQSNIQVSYLQEQIEKEFEVRTFILNKQCYSMAIFSQSSDQTKVDFRNYDKIKPNRNIPIKLPIEVEEKLFELMQAIDMNCGSVDLLFNSQDGFVFLEVNPVGQLDWLAKDCMYPIERDIALTLLNQAS